MENRIKKKLKKRPEIYRRYFFNPLNVIETIVNQYDNKKTIDESICEVVFDTSKDYEDKIYELILYYPNKIKEIKYLTDKVIDEFYLEYGETINIMKTNKRGQNVRGLLAARARDRAKASNIICNITSEDIKLVNTCIYRNVPLEYSNSIPTNNSASLDKIIPQLGYVKGNVQVISMLANNMKSNASPAELITFSKNILKIYNVPHET